MLQACSGPIQISLDFLLLVLGFGFLFFNPPAFSLLVDSVPA